MSAAPSPTAPRENGQIPATREDLERRVLEALWRSSVYRLLATALVLPTTESLQEVARIADRLAHGFPTQAQLLAALARAARSASAEDVASEYLRLCERAAPCPPREGSWGIQPISGRPALLADLAGFYAAFEMRLSDTMGDTEDHIAAELEFLSFLCLKEAYAFATQTDAVAVVADAVQSFWRDHLARFAIPFAKSLQDATALDFYRVVAALLQWWARLECDRLQIAAEETASLASGNAAEAECFTCPFDTQARPKVT
jgi:TorA maturation chaperone TorD